MGKNLIQQRRGKANPRYRSLRFRSIAPAKHVPVSFGEIIGEVVDIVSCPNHAAPLVKIVYDDYVNYSVACEGIFVGQKIVDNSDALSKGNTLRLKDIKEGTQIFNIESVPGDGGKFVRSPGATARLQAKEGKFVTIIMPSKVTKKFNAECRATIGVVAGGGIVDKPILKAGVAFHKAKARHKLWPIVSGSAMNAVDNPMGNKRTSHKSRAKPAPANAPPGRNVGYIRPRRTGQRK